MNLGYRVEEKNPMGAGTGTTMQIELDPISSSTSQRPRSLFARASSCRENMLASASYFIPKPNSSTLTTLLSHTSSAPPTSPLLGSS